MTRVTTILASTGLLGATACADGRQVASERSKPAIHDERDHETSSAAEANLSDASPSAPETGVLRTPEHCPYTFKPSLTPVDPPKIHPRNSAQRVQRRRSRLERIDVVEVSTHRVLFSVDDEVVAAMRRGPDDTPVDWRPDSRTASLPAWPVALLFHVSGEPLPYLGWFFEDDDVYFVNEADPWDPAVFKPGGETFRDVHSIPTSDELSWFLGERLGPYDPHDQLAWKAQRAEDLRCGRVSQRQGDPFPQFPKATIQPANL
ncbi:MAG: hypothetical protein R6X02_16800 [Enhygromyxa sp.]